MPSGAAAPDAHVTRNAEKSRYELYVGEELAGFADYHESGNRAVFTHSEVDEAFSGQGLGSVLASGALDDAVERAKVIVPHCQFMAAHIRKNEEKYQGHVEAPPASSQS